MKILFLHDAAALDGRPDEVDALVQVEAMGEALAAQGHTIRQLGFDLQLEATRRAIAEREPDVVFNLVESVAGHGRLIHLAPSLLDAMGIPYTGAPTDAMFLTSHKVWTKRVLHTAGIATPAWIDDQGRIDGTLRTPGRFIVKSVWEDASLGLDDTSVVDAPDPRWLRDEIQRRRASLGGEAFAEAWIEGREFNVALLQTERGLEVLPIAEMCFVDYPVGKPKLVGYQAKWDDDSFEARHTVRRFELPASDRDLVDALGDLAVRCFERFGLRGYARVDFRVDEDGRPWVLEINPNPCLAPDAGFMAAAERAGLGPVGVAEAIVSAALRARPHSSTPGRDAQVLSPSPRK